MKERFARLFYFNAWAGFRSFTPLQEGVDTMQSGHGFPAREHGRMERLARCNDAL